MRTPRFLCCVLIVFSLVILLASIAAAEDGIPDNCEYTRGEFYRPNLFPRYEPQNRRLLLVDWATGAEIVLAENVDDTRIMGWSLSCRYLATAIGLETDMDTVVWDTLNNARVGAVENAISRPHHITWGPGDYLVVETRSGAILWHVPSGAQTLLTTDWDVISLRSFSRIRWDAANGQVIATRISGGRSAYDLATGAEVPIAAVADPAPAEAGVLIVGANRYVCNDGRYYYSYFGYPYYVYTNSYRGNAAVPLGVYLHYDRAIKQVYLREQYTEDIVQVIEGDLDVSRFRVLGWSPNCRYVAVSVGDSAANDTVIWDVVEARRAGVWTRAVQISHGLRWSPDSTYLLIETSEGGWLWHLSTDTHTLLTPDSELVYVAGGETRIRSFHSVSWNVAGGLIYTVNVGNAGGVTAYDFAGQQIGYYAGSGGAPVGFIHSGNNLLVIAGSSALLYANGGSTGIAIQMGRTINFAFSPDGRYLLIYERNLLRVWDSAALNADGSPNYSYTEFGGWAGGFEDNTSIAVGYMFSAEYPYARLNFVTGERLLLGDQQPILPNNPLPGLSGARSDSPYVALPDEIPNNCQISNSPYYRPNLFARWDRPNTRLTLADWTTGEDLLLLTDNLPDPGRRLYSFAWSPDCRYVYTAVRDYRTQPYDDSDIGQDARYEFYDSIITFWDSFTGEVVRTFESPGEAWTGVYWSPAADRAYLHTRLGDFVWDTTTNSVLKLELQPVVSYNPGYNRNGRAGGYAVYWDYGRGQILLGYGGYVLAFDLRTGQQRYTFNGGSWFSVSEDRRYLLIAARDASEMAIWNLDTLDYQFVDIQFGTGYLGEHATISPDGRYLVIARYNLRVWDLSLGDGLENTYNYPGPFARVRSVRFVDDVTIETTSSEGVQRWNVITGAQV